MAAASRSSRELGLGALPIVLAEEWVEDEPTDFAPRDDVRGLELDAMVMVSTGSSACFPFPRSDPAGVVSPVDTGCDFAEKTEGEASPLSLVEVDVTDEMDESEGVRETEFGSSGGGSSFGENFPRADREDLLCRGRRADASA